MISVEGFVLAGLAAFALVMAMMGNHLEPKS